MSHSHLYFIIFTATYLSHRSKQLTGLHLFKYTKRIWFGILNVMLGEVWLDCSAKRMALRTGWNQWPTAYPKLGTRVPELVLSHSIARCTHLGKCITKQSRNIRLSHERLSGLLVSVSVCVRVLCFSGRQNPLKTAVLILFLVCLDMLVFF